MSIFSQIARFVAGDSTEQANDTNDGSLPSNPFSPPSPAASRPAPTAPIDLTSPTRGSRSSGRRDTQTKTARSSLLKNSRSEDEKRLVGDFHVPADSISAPDPGSYFQKKAMTKPASNHSHKPMDTLYDRPGAAKPKVYGKSTRRPGPSIGKSQGQGQLAFLEKWSPSTASRKSSIRSQQDTCLAQPSPSKRRKIAGNEVIDLSADVDDDIPDAIHSQAPITPARPQNGLPCSSHSTRSRHSVGSDRTVVERQSGSQPKNEFQFIEKQMQSGRSKSKKHGTSEKQRRLSYGHSESGSATPGPQGTPVLVRDDETEPSRDSRRRSIFNGFEQGVSNRALAEQNVPDKARATVSHHFPNARINESTATHERPVNGQRSHSDRKSLGTFRRNYKTVNSDPISDDELAMDASQPQPAQPEKQRSASSTSQTANSGVKRISKAAKAAQGWRLIWARNLDFDSHQIPRSEGSELMLYLKPDGQKGFRIVAYDDVSGHYQTHASITPQDVVKVWLDKDGLIRLEGSRNQDGNQRIVDLEFSSTADFEEFRDNHVAALSGRGLPEPKEEKHMRLFFSKKLNKNNKVGTSNLVDDTRLVADGEVFTENQPKKRSVFEILQNRNPPSLTSAASAGTTQSSIRPTRSTRASAPTHDIEDEEHGNSIEKYSEVTGLGKRWRDPLVFNEGRFRATVDFHDLLRLDEGEFLNDNLIDFYMIYCFKQNNVPQDKVFFFNTFFYSRLTENTGRASINYNAVKRWTSKIDIFNYDYVVVPINEDTHWYLAIICNIGNIKRKAIEEDFGDSSTQDVAAEATAVDDQALSKTAEKPTEPELGDTSNLPLSSRAPSVEQVDNNVNLFDEKSELDLIDREAGPGEEKQQASTHVSHVPEPAQQDTVQEPSTILSQTDGPKTVLSNLNTSSKKKPKRRSIAPKKDPNQPIIIVLDSLSQTRSSAVRALKDWVAAEGAERRSMEAVIRENGYYPKGDQIPTQSNFSDCGVYLMGYAERFFQDPDEFKTKLLLGEMTAEEDWPQLKPAEMRNNLRDILFGLATEQELTEPKKKRGKKAAGVSRAPPQPTVEPVKTGASPALPEVSKVTNPDEASKIDAAAHSVPGESSEDIPHKPTMPRLGSPFKLKPLTSKSVSNADLSDTLSKQDVSSSISPAKTATTTTGQQQTPGRRTHPEVRIPKHSPGSHLPLHDHEVGPEVAQTNGVQRQTKPASRSISPLKRARDSGEDDELRTLPKKKISVERKLASPPIAPPQEGHSDRPIEIVDSQESRPKATQSPRSVHRGSPANRKQHFKSPRAARTLSHAPSIEEISSFPLSTIQRRYVDPENCVDEKLVAKLNADDKQRQNLAPPQLGSRESLMGLDYAGEDAIEPMDVDSRGNDPMDVADDVVGETPSPLRGSPRTKRPWVKGDTLPF
ncbi:hypothetical protein HBI65_120740 [Parastagonospora nodorum]|nr:hypothetical protein HBH95_083970 [Parastagonospora nodorum]KAH5251360.1 hypothetical protein HBI71_154240 [Parastagonospora nodorum]KAH5399753.1 hypothetical protein HBI32_178820 [Parastagonospora nodorum]KAH6094868.1 hypothetical protein HBI65_120740 [Parastagonospora nodorum]